MGWTCETRTATMATARMPSRHGKRPESESVFIRLDKAESAAVPDCSWLSALFVLEAVVLAGDNFSNSSGDRMSGSHYLGDPSDATRVWRLQSRKLRLIRQLPFDCYRDRSIWFATKSGMPPKREAESHNPEPGFRARRASGRRTAPAD